MWGQKKVDLLVKPKCRSTREEEEEEEQEEDLTEATYSARRLCSLSPFAPCQLCTNKDG